MGKRHEKRDRTVKTPVSTVLRMYRMISVHCGLSENCTRHSSLVVVHPSICESTLRFRFRVRVIDRV